MTSARPARPVLRGLVVETVDGLGIRAPVPAGAERAGWTIDGAADVFAVSAG